MKVKVGGISDETDGMSLMDAALSVDDRFVRIDLGEGRACLHLAVRREQLQELLMEDDGK